MKTEFGKDFTNLTGIYNYVESGSQEQQTLGS
jgi:hypothetical protein